MNVQEILGLKGNFVLTVKPDATVTEAAGILAENHVGAIVVTDAAGAIAGILSERDVAVSLPRFGDALGDTPVRDVMTSDVVYCSTETTVNQVLDIMVSNGFRHLPVVENNELIGMVSLRDVVGNWLGAISGEDEWQVGDEPPMDPFSSAKISA